MASLAASGAAAEADPLRRIRTAAFVLLAGAMAWKLFRFLLVGIWAVGDPYELDYGEGIVWQQMRMMLDGTAYGRIDGFPSIVFHYPPLYHAATGALAALGGFDQLAAGRALSLLATLGTVLLVGLVAAKLAPDDRPVRRTAGAVAALVALSWWPVAAWAPLMRVDMLASLLVFSGLWLAMLSLDRERFIYPAALAFVAAVFTKQTMIAAPAAVFGVLLFVRPALAARGIGSAVAAGLAVLGTLAAATDGGFVRHIFLYNVNRFDGQQLLKMGGPQAGLHALYIGAGLFALARSLSRLRTGARSLSAMRRHLREHPGSIRLAFVVAYALLATPMLLMVCKVGSNINYFIEWMLVLSIFVGLAAGEAAKALLGRPGAASGSLVLALLPALLALQAMMLPEAPYRELRTPAQVAGLEQLSARIAAADKPVIADDMVLLLRSGKPVLWEPAIFAELASTGFYDERPFVAKVLRGDFAFFLTFGERGSLRYDQRYTPAVADAIDAAYPRKERHGRLTLHLPAVQAR